MIEKAHTSQIRQKLNRVFGLVDKETDRTGLSASLGMQIIDVGQFAATVERHPGVLGRFFQPEEIGYCRGRTESLAGRLGAKVAVMQVLEAEVPWRDISILSLPTKQPVVQLEGRTAQIADQKGIGELSISMSHDIGVAVAFVVGYSGRSDSLRVGVDIISVKRVANFLARHTDRFLRRHYTPSEIDEAERDAGAFAEKWAGKEAVAKVLGTGIWPEGIAWRQIAILTTSAGLPCVSLRGNALTQANKRSLHNWDLDIISHPETPMAFVIGRS